MTMKIELNNDYWLYLELYAQEEMVSVEAKSVVSQITLDIFKQVQGMEGSESNLLNLQQLMMSAFNSKVHQEHKEELACRIQKALQGKIFNFKGAENLLQSIHSHLKFYLPKELTSSVSQQDSTLSTSVAPMESPSIASISATPSFKPNTYPNALEFCDGTIQADDKLKKLLMEKSLYFRTLWQGEFKEQTEATLKLDSLTKEEFNFFLTCLEKENLLDFDLQQACDLLSILDYFQVRDSKDKYLLPIQEFVQKFDQFKEEDFKTLSFIDEEFGQMPEVKALLKTELSNVKKLSQVFQKPNLQSFDQFLSDLPIEKLDFATYPQLSDQEFVSFVKITSLKEINLAGCLNITGKSLSVLPASLKKLSLKGCNQFADDDLVKLNHLTQLEELDLRGTSKITGTGLAILLDLLKQFNYAESQFTCDDLNILIYTAPITDLKKLDLKLLKSQHFQGCKFLDLSYCKQISDVGLLHLQNLQSLQSLNLSSSNHISNQGLQVLSPLSSLNFLN